MGEAQMGHRELDTWHKKRRKVQMDHGRLDIWQVMKVLIGHKGLDVKYVDKYPNKSRNTGY